MDAARFRQIRHLFESALAQDPSTRAAFVVSACRDDAQLQREVQKLLEAHEETHAILDRPPVELADPAADRNETFTTPGDARPSTKWLPAMLMAVAGLALVCWFTASSVTDIISRDGRAWAGFRFNQSFSIGRVTHVSPGTDATHAGLRRGDLVIAIDGLPLQERGDGPYWVWNSQLRAKASHARPGETVIYRIARGDDRFDVAVRLMDVPRDPVVVSWFVSTALAVLTFVIVGTFVLWRKPADERARVFFFLCIAVACVLTDARPRFHGADSLGAVALDRQLFMMLVKSLVIDLLGLWTASLILHFALCFPTPRLSLAKYPNLRYVIHGIPPLSLVVPVVTATVVYVWLENGHKFSAGRSFALTIVGTIVGTIAAFALVQSALIVKRRGWRGMLERPSWPALLLFSSLCILPVAGQVAGVFRNIPPQGQIQLSIGLLGFLVYLWMSFAFVTSCVVLIRTYRNGTLEQRKQIQWPAWSIAAFALVQAVALVVALFRGMQVIPANLPTAVLVAAGLVHVSAAAIVPLSIAAAILRYRLMDIEVLVRRTIIYGLLTTFVLAGYLVLAGGIGGLLIRMASIRSEWVIIGSTLAIAAFLAPVKTRVQTYVDDRFFGRINAQVSFPARLNTSMLQADSVRDFLIAASEAIQSEFRLRALVLLRKETPGTEYRVEAALGAGEAIFHSSRLTLPRLEPGLIRSGDVDLPRRTAAVLRNARCEFLLPVLEGTTAIACVALGRKLTRKPFDEQEQALLTTVADGIAVGIKSIQLRVDQAQFDSFRQEVLGHSGLAPESLLSECPVCGRCYEGLQRVCEADGAIAQSTLPVVRTVVGRYRLERRIGAGGMGTVYECTDLRLNRTVAIKIMLRSLFGDRVAIRRFDREAKVIASLRHPNIVEIYDFGPIGNEGAYIVMPRLQGRSWRSEVEARGTLSPSLTADWLEQVLSGLEAAHARGVVHCDLKPENLHVSRVERGGALITILDFGLAKMEASEGSLATVTLMGVFAGTPGYVSPEQLGGHKPTERSDIFALGILAVESLTGSRPFDGVAYTPAPRWRGLADSRYTAVRGILARCLALGPNARIPTIASLRAELIGALRVCR